MWHDLRVHCRTALHSARSAPARRPYQTCVLRCVDNSREVSRAAERDRNPPPPPPPPRVTKAHGIEPWYSSLPLPGSRQKVNKFKLRWRGLAGGFVAGESPREAASSELVCECVVAVVRVTRECAGSDGTGTSGRYTTRASSCGGGAVGKWQRARGSLAASLCVRDRPSSHLISARVRASTRGQARIVLLFPARDEEVCVSVRCGGRVVRRRWRPRGGPPEM